MSEGLFAIIAYDRAGSDAARARPGHRDPAGRRILDGAGVARFAAVTDAETSPARSMVDDDFWLAVTFSAIWMVSVSPGRRARGSSNAGR